MKELLVYLILLGSVNTKTLSSSSNAPKFRKACPEDSSFDQIPINRVNTSARLARLRDMFRYESIDAYFITYDDEHQSEYAAPHDRRLEYISGFSGNKGEAVVTLDEAVLWTGGRYHTQADNQLNCDWTLMRTGREKVPTISEWLSENLPNSTIGADPKLVPASIWEALEYELSLSLIELVTIDVNLIDSIWDKPAERRQNKDVIIWPLKYAGKNWTRKVDETRHKMRAIGVDAMIVTALDEIAWLLNIRGRDIPYHPFVRSYVILTHDNITLYIDRYKLIKNNVATYLHPGPGIGSYYVTIDDYDKIWTELPKSSQTWQSVLLPWRSAYSIGTSQKIYSLIPKRKRIPKLSPIIFLKAKKNPTEIEGMERAHIRDGAVLCKFFAYLESQLENISSWTELDTAKLLDTYRSQEKTFFDTSFATIIAFGVNGAQPSYTPTSVTSSNIFDNSTLIIDSGAHYNDGTTDLARTLHLGTPSEEQMDAYTRILMGQIQFSTLIFPANMSSSVADVLTRSPLWAAGFDYLHGSGHGVGSSLSVRESPVFLDYKTSGHHFREGYFISSEPAFYKDGNFGIRLENVVEVVNKPWLQGVNGQTFLGFKEITLVPYEPKLINPKLLSSHHIRWLNDYNSKIRELVGKELKERGEEEAFYWMMEKTKHIPGNSNIIICHPILYLLLQTATILLLINS